jgi:putative transposase
MTRQRSPLGARRNASLLPRVQALKAALPCGGSRRIWAYPRLVDQLAVNQKRSLRRRREQHLLIRPTPRLKATRTPTWRAPKPTQPQEWWGIDMTTALGQGVGWVSRVVGRAWYTKAIVGHYAGLPCTTQHGLAALDRAVNRQFPEGARHQGLSLIRENGCPPTATTFLQACRLLGIQQAFARSHNPTGHADPERMRRTLKEEGRWLHEWTCPFP